MLSAFANDVPLHVCIDANGRLGSSTSKHVGRLNADQETQNEERLRHFLVGANLCAVNTVIFEGDGATWVPTRRRPRRIDFVAVSLPEFLTVKSGLRANLMWQQCVTTIMLWWLISRRCHRKAKHCALRMRNLMCREAFQYDLERVQLGTADIHVDEHHAANVWHGNFLGVRSKVQENTGSPCGLGP